MNRAVLLPTPVDPFMLNYWLHGFNNVWGSEVDHLYIYANSPIEQPVIDYVKRICNNPKITLTFLTNQIEHGDALNRLLEQVTEKNVMLVEDDCYIFKKGYIDQCFRWIESGQYQIVGSKRGSCHPEILERAKQYWGLNYQGLGDQGCNFWPNLYFSSKELLLKTDRNFGTMDWKTGDIIKELGNYTVLNESIRGDTFVWASLQLRAIVPESQIKYVPQYHGHPFDIKHYEERSNLFDGNAPWCHIGSLSSGVHGILLDDQNRPLAYRINRPEVKRDIDWHDLAKTEMEKWEYERRLQWFLTFVEFGDQSTITEFRELYKQAVLRAIGLLQLSIKRVRKRQSAYKWLGLW